MIKLNQYKAICKNAEKILKEFENSKFIFSINELHVVRPHPVFLKNYEVIYDKLFYIKILLIFIKNLFRIFVSIIVNLFVKKINHNELKNYKYIFFSHLFNKSQINISTKKDVYYSHICSNLDKKKYCIVYLNHIKKNSNIKDNKIFLNKSLSFIKEINIFFNLIKSSFKLLIKGIFEKKKLKKKIYLFLFAKCISISTLSNLRVFFQSKEIIKKINPKRVTITYEGHCFERNIFMATTKINSKIQKVAFHHSLSFDNQFSYTMNFKNGSDPDYILASGKSSYTKLKNIIKIKNNRFFLIGSNRISKTKKILNKNFNNSNNCLVLPEGIESETKLFLKFVKKYINNFKDLDFTIRLHPILNHKKNEYKKFFSDQNLNDKRIKFSDNLNVVDDFKNNRFCLYRGTSLIFDAMRHGLYPFYLLNYDEILFDPISNKQKFFNLNKITTIVQLHNIFKKNIFKKKLKFQNPYTQANNKLIKIFYN